MDKYVTLNNGIKIPKLAIGSSAQQLNLSFEAALNYGFTFFDVAYMYYKSEEALGEEIEKLLNKNNIKREDLFIQSKVPHLKAGYKSTLDEFYKTLEKLKIDYLDSYLIHYPQRDKENWRELTIDTWCAMEKLYKDGLIRAIGVSNFLPHHLDFLIKNGEIKPMINQIELHPEHRQENTVNYCKDNNIILQAWSPLGSARSYLNEDIKDIANKHNTTITNIVLNWHFAHGYIPIMGVNSETELQEIKDFSKIEFDKDDIETFRNLKENFTNCHTDAILVDWVDATPPLHPVQPIDNFTPQQKNIYLFNFIPFLKIVKERGNKTKVYLFNIPLYEIKTSILKAKKTKWKKCEYVSGKYKIEPVFNNRNRFLECPVWDKQNNLIFCVASMNNEIYKINPKTKTFEIIPTTKGVIGCIDIDKNGDLITAEETGIYKLNLKTNKRTFITQLKPEMRYAFSKGQCTYNDGKLDAKGRLIVGTSSRYNSNKLYSFDGQNKKILENNITISNGIAWSKDSTKMYYTDSATKKVGLYKYNLETGEAFFERYVISFENGTPDGMCIDIDDNLWVAEFDGKKVSKWNTKTYEKMDEINFPIKVTSCCIGGEGQEYLYVTTCQTDDSKKASGLFRIKIRNRAIERERERERESNYTPHNKKI